MSLWNPYAFTPTGQPVAPVAPPALRVIGGQATAQQLTHAQDAFYRFCASARLSAVPNPAETGRLPDGTRYRIVTVGAQTVMEIWPGGDDSPRRSGIGIVLSTLDGGLVEGHIHRNGLHPQRYILTPEVRRGTRICTGKWRVRMVDDYLGGKAVWGDKSGSRFTTGVNGLSYDIGLLDHRSIERIFGNNNRAYWAGDLAAGRPIYRTGEKRLGSFRHPVDTLPFFRKHSNGELWAMQITPTYYPRAALQLYGEKYTGEMGGTTIGELLDEVSIPAGYTMLWQTISVSPEGNNIRMVMKKVVGYAVLSEVELSVSDDRLSIDSMVDSGGFTTGGTEVITTGDQSPNGTFTWVETVTPGWVTLPGGYGYDAKGGKTNFKLRTAWSGNLNDRRIHREEVRTDSRGVFPTPALTRTTKNIKVTSDEVFPYMSLDYGDRTIRFDAGSSTAVSEVYEVNEYFAGEIYYRRRTGGGTRTSRQYAPTVLFADPLTRLHIFSYYSRNVTINDTVDYTYNDPPGLDAGTVDNSTQTIVVVNRRGLVVKCGDMEVLSVDVEVLDPERWGQIQYVVSSAADPLTGAVCANILEIDSLAGDQAPPLRSWIVLADDTGAKLLHQVMDVPNTTGIRVKKDYELLSVV